MKKFLILFLIAVLVSLAHLSSHSVLAQETNYEEQFFKAKVLEVVVEEEREEFGSQLVYQLLKLSLLDENEGGKIIQVDHTMDEERAGMQRVYEGDKVVVVKTMMDGEESYRFFEQYRLSYIWILLFMFLALVVGISRWQGLSSLIGLGVSLLVLISWVIPAIVSGQSPLLISFLGSVVIVSLTIFLAHGFKKRTFYAYISTLITLVLAFILAYMAVKFAGLFGMGSEEAVSLTLGNFKDIDLRGLLMAAIVIGVIGILDDVTTAQTAVVDELVKANPKLSFSEVYSRSISVGREHIASMINTLVIAYVGASLPVFILISTSNSPWWLILNNEFLAEEIVRSLVGSTALIVAVPIATLLGAYIYTSPRRT